MERKSDNNLVIVKKSQFLEVATCQGFFGHLEVFCGLQHPNICRFIDAYYKPKEGEFDCCYEICELGTLENLFWV
jgi:hypothetical protein